MGIFLETKRLIIKPSTLEDLNEIVMPLLFSKANF